MIDLEPAEDERGFNARMWCAREFREHGITAEPTQANVIYNRRKGTLRGMHWQAEPAAEHKLFRVTRGAVFDAIIDLRPGSPTFEQWTSFEIRAEDQRMFWVPALFAQGFQTLEDDTELTYQVSAPFTPELGLGLRYNDPVFGIDWPLDVTVISEKDRSWPDYRLGAAA